MPIIDINLHFLPAAIEALRTGRKPAAYSVLLALTAYGMESEEMAAAIQILAEHNVTDDELHRWFGQFQTWSMHANIQIARALNPHHSS